MSNVYTINNEWDALAQQRINQITSGDDITYNHFLLPHIEEYIPNKSTILDAGCGVGAGTKYFSYHSSNIIGIDSSKQSIHIARKKYPDIKFINQSICEHKTHKKYDIVILNMVIHSCSSISEILLSAKNHTIKSGAILISMCHPSYWLKYKNINEPTCNSKFSSKKYSIPFTISNDRDYICSTPYFHRSKDFYYNEFKMSGISIVDEKEPIPEKSLMEKYPEPWQFPRYWFLKLKVL